MEITDYAEISWITWSGVRGSNPSKSAWKADAQPLGQPRSPCSYFILAEWISNDGRRRAQCPDLRLPGHRAVCGGVRRPHQSGAIRRLEVDRGGAERGGGHPRGRRRAGTLLDHRGDDALRL